MDRIMENDQIYPKYSYVVDLFQETVEKNRYKTAVIQEERTVTYDELDQWSDRLCMAIQKRMIIKEKAVGIICGRTLEHIVTVLAVLKGGGFYIPIDEHLPSARVEYMLQKAECSIVVGKKSCYEKLTEKFTYEIPLYDYDKLMQECTNTLINYSYKDIQKKNAYVIFTSGSTGQPKGVILSEESLLNLVWGMKQEVLDRHSKTDLQIGVMASFSFDLSVQQIFPAILLGHTLHIIPYEAKFNIKRLIKHLNQVDVCDGTPMVMSMLNQYLRNNREEKLTLKHYISAGETLRKSVIQEYFSLCPNAWVTNAYGPTECTVETTLFHLNKEIEEKYDSIPIGKPIGNMRVYILDLEKNILPRKEKGEIWIAGLGVGKGYIHDEERTKLVFQDDILCANEMMYKTGDLGYISQEGNLCYIGRLDNQIKFKGYRIEIGEIEKVLEGISVIKQCRVMLRQETSDSDLLESCLVAYILMEEETELTLDEILRYARNHLPEYMIPQYFVPVKELVMNANGKLDKHAVPDYKKNALKIVDKTEQINEYNRDPIFVKLFHILSEKVGKIESLQHSLISFGIDSIQIFELLVEIRKAFYIQANISEFGVWMTFLELYEKVKEKYNNNKETPTSFNREKLTKGIREKGKIQYVYEIDRKNRIMQGASFFNHMIYFIELEENIEYSKLNQAYKMLQKEYEAFSMKIQPKGRYVLVDFNANETKELILKENCEVVDMLGNNPMISEINEQVIEPFFDELQEVSMEKELYKLILCQNKKKNVLLVSVHHVIFDYMSLVNFMSRLSSYYYYENYHDTIEDMALTIDHTLSKDLVAKGKEEQGEFYETKKNSLMHQLDKISILNKERFFERISQKKIYEMTEVSFEKMPYCDDTNRIAEARIPANILNAVKRYSMQYEVSEEIIWMSCLYHFIRRNAEEKNPGLLFFTSGRNSVDQIGTIGFYSYLCFLEGNEIQWDGDFLEFCKQVERKKREIEQYNLSNFFFVQGKEHEVFTNECIFDYQKCYQSSEHKLWKRIYPFENTCTTNKMVLRIYDYNKSCQITISYNALDFSEDKIHKFVQAFLCNSNILLS